MDNVNEGARGAVRSSFLYRNINEGVISIKFRRDVVL